MEKRNSQIVIYKDPKGNIKIDVRFDGDTVWLTQNTLADLFQTTKQNIGQHIKNVIEEGELNEISVVKDFFTTAVDGKKYNTKYYNGFLKLNGRDILEDAGKVSHEMAAEIAEKRFDEYKQIEAHRDVDFDEVALKALKSLEGRTLSSKRKKKA